MNVRWKPLYTLKLIQVSPSFSKKILLKSRAQIPRVQAYSSSSFALTRARRKYKTLQQKLQTKHRSTCSLATSNGTTIYALSTAPGRAAIAVIRISGPACMNIYRAFCPQSLPPKPRNATLRTLFEPSVVSVDQQDGQVLDANALVFYFPAPHTATGEDILELHVHGGTAVVKAVLAAIPRTTPKHVPQTVRYAEPGEFTRRAFFNNRLDLLQVEALGDTLAADTEQQRRQAVRGSTSVLTERYEAWRRKLLYARGELEALIDFSEDQHFDESPANLCASVAKQIRQLKSQLQANIESAYRGELLRNGINIALAGAPNAGKSSLLNQIVGREAAIVSSEAGTTRDVVDVNVDIGGFFCRFGDLAGLRRQTPAAGTHQIGEIEKEGIRRAKDRALTADVVVVVLSTEAEKDPASSEIHVSIGAEVEEVLRHIDLDSQKVVCVLNKADLFADNAHLEKTRLELRRHQVLREFLDLSETPLFAVSCTNVQASKITSLSDPGGIQTFLTGLTKLFGRMTSAVVPREHNDNKSNSPWAESLGATERQRLLLLQCLGYLESFLDEVQNNNLDVGGVTGPENDVDVVLAAESLRSAAECLAKIIGRGESGDVEEVLGVVFEKFCVGK